MNITLASTVPMGIKVIVPAIGRDKKKEMCINKLLQAQGSLFSIQMDVLED